MQRERLSDASVTPVGVVVLMGAAAVALLGYGVWAHRRGKATVRWKPVQGQIVWSMMEEWERRRRLFEIQKSMYRPDVRYRYKVGNTEYEGTRIFYGANAWQPFRVFAQPLLDKYPVGRELRVFHDPANPAEAVLERGEVSGTLKWIVAGAGLAILDLALLYIFLR